jgi:hypothetical protein
MVPIAINLLGENLGLGTVLFVDWFGPRGIAFVLYSPTVSVRCL